MLGLIVRCDDTGLGYQTHNLYRMLEPDKILLIDGTKFNGCRQHYDWYGGNKVQVVNGIPSLKEARQFLEGLTAVMTCETFYSPQVIMLAKRMGVKTINQINYEFFDPLQNKDYPQADYYLAPSYWHLPYLKRHHNARYLPPPFFEVDYAEARLINLSRLPNEKARFVHVAGRKAIHDRNGTQSLLDSLPLTQADFELVIYSQNTELESNDPRVTIHIGGVDDRLSMYTEFDAMILPRKYGGLCMPMNEALLCGLPVIMTDISPNNQVLPSDWLINATKNGSFMARTNIDIHEAHLLRIADKLTQFAEKKPDKLKAIELGKQYTPAHLRKHYDTLLEEIGR